LSFLQVAQWKSARVALHSLVGWPFAQLAQVSFDLQVAAVYPEPMI